MKFIWKNKRPRIAKVILSEESEAGGLTIPDLKLYYRTTVTKTAWYWHQYGHEDQWYRIEDGETNTHKYSYHILDKGAVIIHWRKDSLFNKWSWENRKSICSKTKLNPCHSPCTKLNSK